MVTRSLALFVMFIQVGNPRLLTLMLESPSLQYPGMAAL